MKIFLAGAVSTATKEQIDKYDIYKKVILSCFSSVELITPDDIYEYRKNCIKNNPTFSKREIDKLMVDFDLNQVRGSDLVICDISQQSNGMGLELGICKENNVRTIFCFKNGSYVSNMIYGAFNNSPFIEYQNLEELNTKLTHALNIIEK